MKRNFFVCLVVLVVALALALPAVAQDKKDKPKSEKIKNALIVKAAAPDASGKFASVSIQTDKGTFPILWNAIAKKMEPYAGSRPEAKPRFDSFSIRRTQGKLSRKSSTDPSVDALSETRISKEPSG